uniref:AB hydrolase-1 domain-containing protein n=1 Tax=Cucumis melo TaxID=3656 RepID=A0A9I9CVV4_CUCME
MSEISSSWSEEFAGLWEDSGIRYVAEPIGISSPSFENTGSIFPVESGNYKESVESESLKNQVKGFALAWGEILLELGRGCRDIVKQNLITEDSYVQKLRGPCASVTSRLSFLNEFLPEDRDPVYAWPVIFFVSILAFTVICVNNRQESFSRPIMKVRDHLPSASLILLPDGRHMAYDVYGVSADRARFSIIAPHSFLSSRFAGIPGVKMSLLEEFGVRLIAYDLPGFGESDPHPHRNLNSSAFDMLHLADAISINGKFWVLGYSEGAMHAWAALRYIPDRIAGAIMVAPMINPYEKSMTREELRRTWENWAPRKRLLYFLARRFPRFLSYFYRRNFLSGRHEEIERQLSLSLRKKEYEHSFVSIKYDEVLIEDPKFREFWYRNVEESIRQKNVKPFVEETMLLVSNWGFSLADLRVQRKCQRSSILHWLKSLYSQDQCELAGFVGPIHIWQGIDDQAVPQSMTDYIGRILPAAVLHKLSNEGHFSFFYFCDECHRQIFSTIFGPPKGPVDRKERIEASPLEGNIDLTVK